MALVHKAPFGQTTQTGTAVVTLQSVITTDTPTNTALVATAGADGALVTKLTALPRSTVTASSLYLFLSDDGGTTKRLIDNVLMPDHSLEVDTYNAPTIFEDISESLPIRLEASDRLYVSSAVALAAGIVFRAEWTDF